MRLNQTAVDRENYVGKSYVDKDGHELWPSRMLWDDEIPGFGMRIHPPVKGVSRKEFLFTYSTGPRSRVMNLGVYGVACSLKQARRAAGEALTASRRGVDPIEARQAASGVGTVEDVAQKFLDRHASGPRKNIPGGN